MDPAQWLFDGWDAPLRTLVIGVAAYAGLLAILRVSGKRTLSKMNTFDLVVTVAFGSALAAALTNRGVSATQAITAFAVLAALQFVVATGALRSRLFDRVVKSRPALLAFRGELLEDALRKERVTADEVMAALRESGAGALDDVEAVVLETNGSFSVVGKRAAASAQPSPAVRELMGDAGPRAAEQRRPA